MPSPRSANQEPELSGEERLVGVGASARGGVGGVAANPVRDMLSANNMCTITDRALAGAAGDYCCTWIKFIFQQKTQFSPSQAFLL